ncbi:MAG TPA: hypothetical protein VGJ21_11375 [Terracidiphilus sp.]|jgi:hypothetical protein
MKHMRLYFAIAVMAAQAVASSQQPEVPKPQPDVKKVHGEGCVEAGVDARCMLVRDLRAGRIYNILVGDPRPTPGEGIEFTGTLHQGANVCMQGAAIEVEHWARKESIKCRHSPAPRK